MANEIQTKSFGYDVFDLIKFSWEKRRILISITLIAFILSIVVSLMIKPRYKSTIIMFPVAEISLSKSIVETQVGSNNEKDVLTFGDDIDAERLLQILRSDQLLIHLINKFDLIKYYQIDTTKHPNTTIRGILGESFKCKRTEYNSIEVEVFDHDPKIAADMANEIAAYADTIFYKVTNKRAKEALDLVQDELQSSQTYMDQMTDSLGKIRAYGINDYKSQANAFNKAYASTLIKRDSEGSKSLEKKLEILQKYGGVYDQLNERLRREIQRFSLLRGKYAIAKVNYEHKFSNVFIVDKAIKADKKDSPKRSIIVLVSTFSAFLFVLLGLVVAENIRKRL